MSDTEEIRTEPIRQRKGQNMKGVENKRAKALANLKAGREKRQALLKAKREAESNDNMYDLDSSDSDSDEEVNINDLIVSKKKPKMKAKHRAQEKDHDNMREEISRMKEAIMELSKRPKQKKHRSTKLVMLPAQNQQVIAHVAKASPADDRYEQLRRSILGR